MDDKFGLITILMPYFYDEARRINEVKANLYGLDIILSTDGKYFINEINGCRSGMKGFKQVYGDNRVEDEVFERLSSLGDITVNDGTFRDDTRNKNKSDYRKKHPVRTYLSNKRAALGKKIFNLISRNISEEELAYFARINRTKSVLKSYGIWSEKLDMDWMFEDVPESSRVSLPFERYAGQPSLVFNIINDYLPHPTVNSFVEESIANNKFLQYMLLKDERLPMCLPKTTLVGLGVGDRSTLENLIAKHDLFVKKPFSACCGIGVEFIGKEKLDDYIDMIGPIREPGRTGAFFRMLTGITPLYVEDLVARQKFNFEIGMHVIQPFIDSKGVSKKDCYSTIRAIVCNGEFVDAYMRYSPNQKVNLAQDAKAASFKDGKLGRYCEEVIKVFNDKCGELTPYNFRTELYNDWFDEAGRNPFVKRYMRLFGMEQSLTHFVSVMMNFDKFQKL